MSPDPYSLDNLRDIVEPAFIPWWPPALGVWLLLALVAVWLVAGLGLWWVRWRRRAYRRAGLRELRGIAARPCERPGRMPGQGSPEPTRFARDGSSEV